LRVVPHAGGGVIGNSPGIREERLSLDDKVALNALMERAK
jgi:hypothetical protein